MARVTIFAGLCGSGKTFESKKLERQYIERGETVEMFQEIFGREQIPELIKKLKEGIDCIVEEAICCIEKNRDNIAKQITQEVPKVEIKWVVFENNLGAANENVTIRTNEIMESKKRGEIERLQGVNQKLSQEYGCPEGCTPTPIHRRTQQVCNSPRLTDTRRVRASRSDTDIRDCPVFPAKT